MLSKHYILWFLFLISTKELGFSQFNVNTRVGIQRLLQKDLTGLGEVYYSQGLGYTYTTVQQITKEIVLVGLESYTLLLLCLWKLKHGPHTFWDEGDYWYLLLLKVPDSHLRKRDHHLFVKGTITKLTNVKSHVPENESPGSINSCGLELRIIYVYNGR